MSNSTFDQIVEWIKIDSTKLSSKYGNKTLPDKGLNFIDIDKFLDVLYSLLESNDYLLKDGDKEDPNKFLFTEEYPDIETEKRNTITFEVFKRTPANLSANSDPFKGTSNYRPMYIGEEDDGTKGGKIVHLQSMYDNRIRFRCWSPKTAHARKMASLMESILTKYYWVLRQYVPVLIYEGRGDGRITNEYGDNRYQGIHLDMFVRTNERLILREQEIVSFEHDLKLSL